MPSRRFKPSLWGTLAALIGIAAGVAFGLWQVGRAEEKLQLAAVMEHQATALPIQISATRVSAQDLDHRRVEARGHFDPRGMVLLDNRVRGGRVGYEVIMPLRLVGTQMHILVNRGWIVGTGDRRRLPDVTTPVGEVSITGLAVVPGQKLYELSEQAIEGIVWQNLTIERYSANMDYSIHPIVIRQSNDAQDGLVRDWAVSERQINVHRSYAFQWFALAVLVLIIYLAMSFKRDPTNA
jgi:surfeit locus 1 family protein